MTAKTKTEVEATPEKPKIPAAPKADAKGRIEYEVIQPGFYYGSYYKKGDALPLHPRQAEIYLPPFGNELKIKGA